ncbi:MAG: hypothetical protein OXL37_04670 [Chloroflexota bacterium]|nr:hypothetical protein [Chloroflexota bacterium]MDE2961005.1 hypothetical protein [Chloroflexota bacterium]
MDDTQIIQWTIIGSAVAIILVAIGLGGIAVWVIKAAMNSVRSDLKADIAELRAELKGDIADLKLDIQANRNEITTNRRLLGRFSLHRHGDDGLPLAPLTDSLDPPEGTGGSNDGDDD